MDPNYDYYRMSDNDVQFVRMVANSQGELFEHYAEQQVNMEEFIPAFLKSEFCNKCLDAAWDYEQSRGYTTWRELVEKEINTELMRHEERIPDVNYFARSLGYLLRLFQKQYDLCSREIAGRLPLSEILKVVQDLEYAGNDNTACADLYRIYNRTDKRPKVG